MRGIRQRVSYALGRPTSDAERRGLEVQAFVRRATRGDGPVLVGPWRGDVGYEILYWLPFIRQLVAERPELRDRIVAVSRGGVDSWYTGVAGRYLDAFDLLDLEEMRTLGGGDGAVVGEKPTELTPLDRELLLRAGTRLGLREPGVLLPELVSVLMRLTKADDPSAGDALLRFAPVAPPPGALDGIELPERFIAMRFYRNSPLPGTPEVARAVAEIVTSLARRIPVVMLGHELGLDGHGDVPLPDGVEVMSLASRMKPRTNLGLQTAVIARADAFVGTYGGLSYLAPLVGTPSFAFYSDRAKVNPVYLRLGRQAAAMVDQTYFVADLADRRLRDVLSAIHGG